MFICEIHRFLERKKERASDKVGNSMRGLWVYLSARFAANRSLWVLAACYLLTTIALAVHRVFQLGPMSTLEYWYCTAKVAGE